MKRHASLGLLLLLAGCKEGPKAGSSPSVSPAASPPLLAAGSGLPLPAARPPPGALLVGNCEYLDGKGNPRLPGASGGSGVAAKRPALVERAHRANLAFLSAPGGPLAGLATPGAAGREDGKERSFSYCSLSQTVLSGVTLVASEAVLYTDLLGDQPHTSLLVVTEAEGRSVLVRYDPKSGKRDGRWLRVASCPPGLGRQATVESPVCTDLTEDFQDRAGALLGAPALDRAAIESFALLLAAVATSAPMARILSPEEMDDRDIPGYSAQDRFPRPSISSGGALLYVETSTSRLSSRGLLAIQLDASSRPARISTSLVQGSAPPFEVQSALAGMGGRRAEESRLPLSVKQTVRIVAGELEPSNSLEQLTGSLVPAVKGCYGENPPSEIAGRIELAARVDRSGRLGPPQVMTSGAVPSRLAECAEKALSNHTYLSPKVAPLEFVVSLQLRTYARWPGFPF